MFIKQHFLFVYRSQSSEFMNGGNSFLGILLLQKSVGHAHPQSPVQWSHKPNSCHRCHQRCPLCAEEPSGDPEQNLPHRSFLTSKSDFLPFITS